MNATARAAMVTVPLVACLGCASGRPPQPAIEFVQPPSDRAYIYVYRNEGLSPGRIELWLDGVLAGGTGRRSFAFFQVRPGRHVLASGTKDAAELALNVLGGEVVYVKQDTTVIPAAVPLAVITPLAVSAIAVMATTSVLSGLQRVSRAEGRAGVRECRLIRDPPPRLPPVVETQESAEIPLTGGPRPKSQ